MKKLIIFLSFLALGQPAVAGLLLDVGGVYIGDDLSGPSDRTSTKYFYNLGALFSFNKNLWGGWSYSGLSHSETITTTINFNSQDTGPCLKWQFGRNEIFNLGATLNIVSKATYQSATTSENWEGMSFLLQFGVAPEVSQGLRLGASLNYYSASYSKKIVNNVESSASNAKSWIFPTINLSKEW